MSDPQPPAPQQSKGMTWGGRILSILPAPLLVFSAVMKFSSDPEMAKNVEKMGWTMEQMRAIGIVELACLAIYLIPQTAVLGAILLTGYLGGATATHVRIHEPWFPPVIVGVIVWLGIFLREPRLRALLPFRKI